MILTVDIGNSRKKFSLFKNSQIIQSGYWEKFSELPKCKNIVLSQVGKSPNKEKSPQVFSIKEGLKKNHFFDMPTKYSSSIGEDRLAACYYLYREKKSPSICIDIGTFTTIDILSSNGHEGGYILPGPELIEKVYEQGNLLSRGEMSSELNIKTPLDTTNAINSGATYTILSPILAILQHYNGHDIYLTGGKAPVVALGLSHEKNNCKFVYDEHIVHKGLHLIGQKVYS